ncbi:hypothetical protein BDN72DRAFT_865940 [Pluteus cervinus]|uniref:Uncharacterized protein n=1 Tax=Pluteus cervinus TaxID=181527 RepID=A0ACD2ZZ31_9AGAR|nr:hypothetical protein BDN72DRAFT_865940 [Pluteus cervinus]
MYANNIPSNKDDIIPFPGPLISSPTPPPVEEVLRTYKAHSLMPLTSPESSEAESLTPPDEPTDTAKPFNEPRQDGYQIHISNKDMKQVCDETDPENYKGIHKIHTFAQIGNFVNPGNMDANQCHIPSNKTHIALANNENAAVALMPGMVISSSIICPGPAPSKGGLEAAMNKNICIAPLSSTLQKTVSTLSDIMDTTALGGPVKPHHGLIFQTLPYKKRVEDTKGSKEMNSGAVDLRDKLNQAFNHNRPLDTKTSYGTTPNGVPIPPPTPSTSSGPAMQASRFIKTVRATPGPLGMEYPIYQPCQAVIPIYDGRASTGSPFNFSYQDFANLKQGKRYEGGLMDLTHEDLVVVGYTINTFGTAPPNVCFNLQFVILMNSNIRPLSN